MISGEICLHYTHTIYHNNPKEATQRNTLQYATQ